MGFNLKNGFQGRATTCSPERIKKWEYFAANIVCVFNPPSEVVHLHHGVKNEGKNTVKTEKGNCIHWKILTHPRWSCFILFWGDSPPTSEWQICKQKHKLTGREQNRPLHWPFFLKLWPWPLEEKGKKIFFFLSYLI